MKYTINNIDNYIKQHEEETKKNQEKLKFLEQKKIDLMKNPTIKDQIEATLKKIKIWEYRRDYPLKNLPEHLIKEDYINPTLCSVYNNIYLSCEKCPLEGCHKVISDVYWWFKLELMEGVVGGSTPIPGCNKKEKMHKCACRILNNLRGHLDFLKKKNNG
jgi:hypothetical protein